MEKFGLKVLPDILAICRLPPETNGWPDWARSGSIIALTRTDEEVSVVCSEADVPAGVTCEKGWRGLKVEAVMDLALVGVLAGLVSPLAQAGINIFALSTFNTDYVLVEAAKVERAIAVLRTAGYTIN